ALAAYAHQDVPFERLVEVLDPERSMGRNPLFQVMLILQNNERAELRMPGLRAVPEHITADAAKLDLTFNVMEDGVDGGLDGFVEYSADVFDESTAASMAERLVRLLEQVALEPELSVGGIEVLSEDERRRALVEWNDTARPLPATTLPQEFQRQVERTPDAVAVIS
ncbi:condensation domain-containing protein, partial [Streptomyces sp. ASQP_92]|uniref:condensation domain-containing protein n=1 Tax=Streptomyces sp. ASQP_92 TaxID=2979116 RepID=UPI0021BE887E